VVAAGDGADDRLAAYARFELTDEAGGRSGWRVAAVGESVQDDAVSREAQLVGQPDQRLDVLVDGVDASGTDEREDMETRAVIESAGACRPQRRIRIKRPVLDGFGDSRQVLDHPEPRPQVEVSHLRIAHLAGGQPDCRASCLEARMRPALEQPTPGRHVGGEQRVPAGIVVEPKAVEDAQHHRPMAGRGGRPAGQPRSSAAQATIRPKAVASRDAPPTSAPSTSGWAKNSRALSGVTLPP